MDRRVQQVIDRIEADMHRGMQICEMARFVNLSPSRLHSLFRAEVGITPARYLKQVRMQKAKKLAENTFLSTKQIMAQVGVDDRSHFMRDFKRFNGKTLNQHRGKYLKVDVG